MNTFDRHKENTLSQGHAFCENTVPGQDELLDRIGARSKGIGRCLEQKP